MTGWESEASRQFETERLRLRPPTFDDAEAIFSTYATDPEVTRYLEWAPHQGLEDTRAFLGRCAQSMRDGRELAWVLEHGGSGVVVGMLSARPRGHMADLGYVLARPHWGQGLMVEAVRPVVDWLLADPRIYRVWAICDVDNVGSARVLEKAGFSLEGVLRKWMPHCNLGPIPRDVRCYSMVTEETTT